MNTLTTAMKNVTRKASSVLKKRPSARLFSSNCIIVDNPYSGETYCELGLESAAEVLAKVDRAAATQREWQMVSLEERIALCDRFVDAIEGMKDQIATDITGQMGRTFGHGEAGGVIERTQGMMALAPEVLAEEVLEVRNGCERVITKEPVGVVLCIAPWNYPLLTAVNCIVPAILAGNSVIVRHSARTPLCAVHFEQAFEKAGAPPGLIQAVQCAHDVVPAMIADPQISFVSFTGSVGGGHTIYQEIAKTRFIDATLELGGNDPVYVAADCDAAGAAEAVVDGAMFNAGQSCCGTERVYVHRSQYDEFIDAAKAAVDAYQLGDPMDPATSMGPMAQESSLSFLAGQVQEAKDKGATIISGGTKAVNDAAGKGRFYPPTLLSGCDHSMNIMMEESFGPVLPVQVVDSDEEAVGLMKDSPYGLTAAIFTKEQQRVRDMGRQIGTGTIFMNRCDYLDPELPWTAGGEHTGKGVSLSKHGFGAVTKLKGYNMRVE
jgi:acyl-CoA reductase-like NAD-dependent aldehyde dehydrogenase